METPPPSFLQSPYLCFLRQEMILKGVGRVFMKLFHKKRMASLNCSKSSYIETDFQFLWIDDHTPADNVPQEQWEQ